MGQARIFQLDVLRGFAIFMVMGVHVPAYPIWSNFGGYGVDLFFVLSGFLISNLLFAEYRKNQDIRLGRFWARRALKLYPSFYLLFAVTLTYCLLWRVPIRGREILGEAILTQNYIGAIWGHTWSLAVEEHFYIFLPLLLLYLMKRNPGAADPFRSIPAIFGVVALACLGLRIAASQHPDTENFHPVHWEPTHLRADTLFFGVFVSYLHNFRPEWLQKATREPWRLPVALISVLGFVPAFFLQWTDPIVYTVGFTCLYIAFGSMLVLTLYQEKRKRPEPGRGTRAFAQMGRYSYTIYLWHVPLAQLFAYFAGRWGMVNQYVLHAIYFATTVALAVALSKLVELPALRLRERLFPRDVQPAPRREATPPVAVLSGY
jgi:peptidoglycan/LPS O-acetylase OafA/YrhL